MDAYFKGSVPFKEQKNRLDIPDAFIYLSLLDIVRNHGKVIFISRDKDFLKRIDNKNIITFEALSELFQNKEYAINDEYINYLKENEKAEFLLNYFKEEIYNKLKRKIELSDIIEEIDQEVIDKVIGKFEEISSNAINITIEYKKIKVIRKLSYLIPFSVEIIHLIKSEASKEELSYVDEYRKIALKDKEINENDLFDIKEDFLTKLTGNFSITFEGTSPLTWHEIIIEKGFFSESELNEITINVEDIGKST